MSPTEIRFGHQVRDYIPVLPDKYVLHYTWSEMSDNRVTSEGADGVSQQGDGGPDASHQDNPPLKVGDIVWFQNQMVNSQPDQYAVKLHGSDGGMLHN
jgi:hypothetical protein